MNVSFNISTKDLVTTSSLWALFSHVLAIANAEESSDPRNEKFDKVREHLAEARNFLNNAEDLLDHADAASELGRAYERLTGDASLRKQVKELKKGLTAQILTAKIAS